MSGKPLTHMMFSWSDLSDKKAETEFIRGHERRHSQKLSQWEVEIDLQSDERFAAMLLDLSLSLQFTGDDIVLWPILSLIDESFALGYNRQEKPVCEKEVIERKCPALAMFSLYGCDAANGLKSLIDKAYQAGVACATELEGSDPPLAREDD